MSNVNRNKSWLHSIQIPLVFLCPVLIAPGVSGTASGPRLFLCPVLSMLQLYGNVLFIPSSWHILKFHSSYSPVTFSFNALLAQQRFVYEINLLFSEFLHTIINHRKIMESVLCTTAQLKLASFHIMYVICICFPSYL